MGCKSNWPLAQRIPVDAAVPDSCPVKPSPECPWTRLIGQSQLRPAKSSSGWSFSGWLFQPFSSALASTAGQEVIRGPFIKHWLFCKTWFSNLEPVMQWCWLMTSLCIHCAGFGPKMMNFNRYPHTPATSMVHTWHSVGLEVRVSDGLWALCLTECDNEWAARRPPSFAPDYSGDCVWFVVSVQLGSLQSGPKSVSAPEISKTLHLVCQHFLWRRKFRHVNTLLFSAIAV